VEAETCGSYAEPDFRAAAFRRKRAARRRAQTLCAVLCPVVPIVAARSCSASAAVSTARRRF
jgi:predicted component of type VI protein secretion system